MSAVVLADKLGRTRQSIANKRYVLGIDYRPNTQDYDRRPSGWYDETVGGMLIACKDAFGAWRHYHRYVIVEYDGEVKDRIDSWVTLRCYRDADAE